MKRVLKEYTITADLNVEALSEAFTEIGELAKDNYKLTTLKIVVDSAITETVTLTCLEKGTTPDTLLYSKDLTGATSYVLDGSLVFNFKENTFLQIDITNANVVAENNIYITVYFEVI